MLKHSLVVDIKSQTMNYYRQEKLVREFRVSTAKNGPGQMFGSQCTPLGLHILRAKIGATLPINAVLVKRRWTGEVYSSKLKETYPYRDWILTRIIWLSGCEVGFNRLKNVDSMRRFIYIHGTPDTEPMGRANSHGCIRMRNNEIIELFDSVPLYTKLLIQ